MTTEIQQLKEDIAVLQEKLQKLEEIEKQPRMNLQQEGEYAVVSYHDKVYYRLEGEVTFSWYIKKGVSANYRVPTLVMVNDAETERLLEGIYYNHIQVKKEKEQQVKELVKESVKWCEEHPDKDPLDWLKPQTPEQVADGLKEAFREAVKQGVVSSSNKPQNPSLMKTKAQEVLYAYMDVERDLSQPKILIHTLKELINQLQVSPGIIKCPDIIELCEELKKL